MCVLLCAVSFAKVQFFYFLFTGYLIEKRSGKGAWVKAMPNLVTGNKATVTGLPFGKEVEFRVCAVNDGGPGDFSRTTGPQMIKDKTSKFKT